MILTGKAISNAVVNQEITLDPFCSGDLNPNSYNYHIGSELLVPTSVGGNVSFRAIQLSDSGMVLESGITYLGHTHEIIGSTTYAMSLIGRSSIGRLGLFLQVSANLGHTGSVHRWTLELVAVHRIRIYPRMTIGQVSFWKNQSLPSMYSGHYGRFSRPTPSAIDYRGEK